MEDTLLSKESAAEAALWQRIAARDHSAIADLYDRCAQVLYALIWRIVPDSVEAESVFAETFTRAWAHPDDHNRRNVSPSTWLVLHAREIAIVRARASGLTRPMDENVDSNQADATGTRREVLDAVVRIPRDEWTMIEQAFFHGYTQSKLAELSEVPVEVIRNRMQKTLSTLMGQLEHLVGQKQSQILSLYLEELAALDSVGALDGEDVGEFKRIAPNMADETRKEISRYKELAALLARSCARQEDLPAGLKERVMKCVQEAPTNASD